MVRAHQFFRLLALWCLCCLGCQDQPPPAMDGLSGNQAPVIRQQSVGSEQSVGSGSLGQGIRVRADSMLWMKTMGPS